MCHFSFTDQELGCGRTDRKIKFLPGEKLSQMRIFVDTSCVEIYINDGAYVFTTKLFRRLDWNRTLSIKGAAEQIRIYRLDRFEIKG